MIDQICEYFNVTKEQILSSRDAGDSVIVVINYGIAGDKKFEVAKADLAPKPEPKPAATKKTAKKPASKKEAK